MTEVNDSGEHGPLGALFSTLASDNAEVVPPDAPHGPESMWSTQASVPADEVADEPPPAPGPGPGANGWTGESPPAADWAHEVLIEGPFSAEPVDRDADVLDEGDLFDPTGPGADPWSDLDRPDGAPSVFSSGPAGAAPAAAPSVTAPESPWTTLEPEWPAAPPASGVPPIHDAPPAYAAHQEPAYREPAPAPAAGAGRRRRAFDDAVADPHGLESAVSRLGVADRELAQVPIAVCGALLEEDEYVLGVVTGQMLGRTAAVVVTEDRVIIANDRRWQPLVDVYQIDSKLVVRGRHDRQVAALSFADDARLSMVDGITEVELAIELAERIRDAGPVGEPDR